MPMMSLLESVVRSNPVVVVLAAGKGSRFVGARHKLEQPLGTSSVLGTTLSHALFTELPVVVVTTAAMSPLVQRYVAARDIVVLPSDAPSFGMGDSIAAGVAARAQAPGWVVLPADMPLIQPQTIVQVAAELETYPVVYAQHGGRRGHPVGFSAELFSDLVKLSGDEGARRLLGRYPAFGVDVHDAGVLADVDTVADLVAVQQAHDAVAFARTMSGPLAD